MLLLMRAVAVQMGTSARGQMILRAVEAMMMAAATPPLRGRAALTVQRTARASANPRLWVASCSVPPNRFILEARRGNFDRFRQN